MRTLLVLLFSALLIAQLIAETESLPFVFRYFASGPDNPLAQKKKGNPACKKPTPKPSVVSVHVEGSNHQEPPDDDDDDNITEEQMLPAEEMVPVENAALHKSVNPTEVHQL